MRLSIIVCTRNRAYAIVPCLDSIAASLAQAAPVDAEIVVVDNGSSDDTSTRVREWAATSTFPVNLQHEPRTGLCKARNLAIRAAQGDLLIWTDDDCRMDKNYINIAQRHDAADTKLVLRGGRVELGDPTDLPLSIKTDEVVQRWHKQECCSEYDLNCALLGANMMMRRALVDKLGFFDESYGPGTNLPGSDDVDYIYRAYHAHMSIEYMPDLIISHHHGRKSTSDGYKLMRNYVISWGGLYMKYLFKDPKPWRPCWRDIKNAVREVIHGKNYFRPEIGLRFGDMIFFWSLGSVRYFVGLARKAK